VHKKLDFVSSQFDGLRDYLYEIDPQFDEERQLWNELNDAVDNDEPSFSVMAHIELTQRKENQGRRTLSSGF
jgi:formiminotetrahydrofolate cyclodeaminase